MKNAMVIELVQGDFSSLFHRGWEGKLMFGAGNSAETYQVVCKSRYLLKDGVIRIKFEAEKVDNHTSLEL